MFGLGIELEILSLRKVEAMHSIWSTRWIILDVVSGVLRNL